MGTATVDAAAWFEIDGEYAAQMGEKEHLLAARRAAVFACLPPAERAAAALRDEVAAWALASPFGFARHEDGIVCPDGRVVSAAAHPLEAAARLVQEDLCLMLPDARGVPVLAAACLCFPSRWVLAEKLGQSMQAIHAPVPALNDKLGATIDRFLAGLKPGRIYARCNWSLTTDPALHQPVALPHAPIAEAEAGKRLFYRVERQTLRRLGEGGAVVFGIRIHQHPLERIPPEWRMPFAEAIAALDPAMIAYKSMAAVAPAAVAYLRRPVPR
ncbi:MAG: DUF3445 domain-containing protein [Rhodospirillaceae bacterium]|nr:DUF3445 domain-containing protein [Rhodospirillaceae bacterium]